MSADLQGSGSRDVPFNFERPGFLNETDYQIKVKEESGEAQGSKKLVMEITYLGRAVSKELPQKNIDSLKLKIAVNADKGEKWAKDEFTHSLNLLNEAATECFLPDGNKGDFSAFFAVEEAPVESNPGEHGLRINAEVRNRLTDKLAELSPPTQTQYSKYGDYLKSQQISSHAEDSNPVAGDARAPESDSPATRQPASRNWFSIARLIDGLSNIFQRLIPGQHSRSLIGNAAQRGQQAPTPAQHKAIEATVMMPEETVVAQVPPGERNPDVVDVSGGYAPAPPPPGSFAPLPPDAFAPLPPGAMAPLPPTMSPELNSIALIVSTCSGPGKRAELVVDGDKKTLQVRDFGLIQGKFRSAASPDALRFMLQSLITSNDSPASRLALYNQITALKGYSAKLDRFPDLKAFDVQARISLRLSMVSLMLSMKEKIAGPTLDMYVQKYNEVTADYRQNPQMHGQAELKSVLLATGRSLMEAQAGITRPPNLQTLDQYIDLIGQGDRDVQEVLLWGHRNNGDTRHLFGLRDDASGNFSGPMLDKMRDASISDKFKGELLEFARDYLERGYSIPINPLQKRELQEVMTALADAAAENEILKPKADELKALAAEKLNPPEVQAAADVGAPAGVAEAYDFDKLPTHQIYQDLASILTEKFQQIEVREFDREGWTKDAANAPTVRAYTQAFQQASYFILGQIIKASDAPTVAERQQQCVASIKKTLQIGQEAMDNHNVALAAAISGALANSAIDRLIPGNKNTAILDKLSSKDKEILARLRALMASDFSNQNLRLENVQSLLQKDAIVPYLGIFLKDTIFLGENHDRNEEGTNINGYKVQVFAQQKKTLSMLQDNLAGREPADTPSKRQLESAMTGVFAGKTSDDLDRQHFAQSPLILPRP